MNIARRNTVSPMVRKVATVLTLAITFLCENAAHVDAGTISLTLSSNLQSGLTVSAQPFTVGSASTCLVADRNAEIDGSPYREYPLQDEDVGITGAARVAIDLGADGTLTRASLTESSGDWLLDDAAMRTAKLTKYSPELRNCKPIAGSYILTVGFSIN